MKKRPPTFRQDSLTYVDVARVLKGVRKSLTLAEIELLRCGVSTTASQVLRQMVQEGRVKKVSVTAYKWVGK